jgi:hypothetical protein
LLAAKLLTLLVWISVIPLILACGVFGLLFFAIPYMASPETSGILILGSLMLTVLLLVVQAAGLIWRNRWAAVIAAWLYSLAGVYGILLYLWLFGKWLLGQRNVGPVTFVSEFNGRGAGLLLILVVYCFLLRYMLVQWSKTLLRSACGPRACANCGYNPTGNVSGVCPECGEQI